MGLCPHLGSQLPLLWVSQGPRPGFPTVSPGPYIIAGTGCSLGDLSLSQTFIRRGPCGLVAEDLIPALLSMV